MFYSHQLLCKKGPLGQIWIAATMHAKINRRKTEQIDIEAICKQILQPQVPLALRLSGILMGGVVLIFHRKVKFLQDDVTEFLLKIKTVMYKKSNDNIISLPKGKSLGKHENLTINYDFDAFDDIERPMMRPNTPEQRSSDRDTFRSKEYIIITKPKNSPRQLRDADVDLDRNAYVGPDHLRADIVDITLDDNNHSFNGQFGDFDKEILEERLPATYHDPMDLDTFFPDIRLSEEIKAPPSGEIQGNSMESQEQQPDQDPRTDLQTLSPSNIREELVGPESPDQREDTADTAPTTKMKRKRQARRKVNSVLDECLEIPAPVFATWLRDREDLVGREKAKKKDSDVSRVEMLFRLPSSSLSHWTCAPELEPEWTDELVNLWNMDICAKSKGARHFRDQRSRKASPLLPDTSVQGNNDEHSKSHSDPSDRQSGGEFHIISSSSETLANVDPDAEKLQDVPPDNGANFTLNSVDRFRSNPGVQGQLDVRDHGSVEKLRAALRSPSSGSEDHFRTSQLGLTPSLVSGQFGTNAGGRLNNRSFSTPGSGKLPFDVEVEPSSGGSGRFMKSRLSSPGIGLGDFPADAPDTLGSSDYFANLRGTLRGSLTQFDLQEETAASAQLGSGKQDGCLNNVSVTVLQCLQQNFNELGARCKEHQSLDDLAQGMNRSEAAKMFYHILVLRSNNYLIVSQNVPYGDILLSRGHYL